MNEQDKKILELYQKDSRRRRILIFSFIVTFIICASFYRMYIKDKDVDNIIQEETKSNIINENITNETNASNIETTAIQNNIEKQNEVSKNTQEIKAETRTEQKIQETKEKTKTQVTTTSNNKEKKDAKEKPKNKDFLFKDGYTMDNVIQAAQDYLKSYEFSGECIPIKDNDGVYLGMRVIFY